MARLATYKFVEDHRTSPIEPPVKRLDIIPKGTIVQGIVGGNPANDTASFTFDRNGYKYRVSLGRNSPVRPSGEAPSHKRNDSGTKASPAKVLLGLGVAIGVIVLISKFAK